jgi:hypothetical protein
MSFLNNYSSLESNLGYMSGLTLSELLEINAKGEFDQIEELLDKVDPSSMRVQLERL